MRRALERGGPFGRSIESPETVWVPQHARGRKARGVAIKDYEVRKPPTGEGAERVSETEGRDDRRGS
jgi:hypothetical protein